MSSGRPLLAAVVLAALASAAFSGQTLRPLLKETALADIPYGVSTALNLIDLSLLALAIVILGGKGGRNLFTLSGLSAPIVRPLIFAALIFAPAAAIAAFTSPIAKDLAATDIAFTGIVFPVMEEIGFRGLAIGALMTLCGWRFMPAALAPAALFGLAHLAQGDAPAEIAGIVAITGLGGLLFGWLFVRWGFNLWPPIFLHVGLNTLWSVFDLGENALGGWLGNALRLGAVAAAIGFTFLLSQRTKISEQAGARR